jgi:hypothetical protein
MERVRDDLNLALSDLSLGNQSDAEDILTDLVVEVDEALIVGDRQ